MNKFFEERFYDEGVSNTEEVGHCNEFTSMKRYEFINRSKHSITGLYHYENNYKCEESATQIVYFRVKDLKQLPSFVDRIVEVAEVAAILELAEDITGWYAFGTGCGYDCSGRWFSNGPSARFVGKSKNWVRVSQYSARDV